jgi:putative acyl-CoA dehydrogenase
MHNLVRAAKFYMASGVEAGHLCPVTMTNASVPVLMKHEGLSREWMPKLLSDRYDPSSRPVSSKAGAMIGMGMTEREGGSDVNAALTSAAPLEGGVWRIDGQKWFMSAPMCDAFMVLAQTGEGLGCFMLPRILPDGSKNGLEFQRLKNKLGNRSNASSEVEFRESLGFLVGEPGRGVATIMEMVGLTRLDCAISSAGLMRASLAEAVHHCRHRSAFGNRLIDQPLMQRVLADMALDVAAASALVFRLARAFDKSGNDPEEAAYVRLMTPVIKYWVCKMAPSLIYEVLECLGGNGYIEEGNLARHYREAPLNAIWEGAGNIMCLDVLRVIGKSKSVLNAVLDGLENDLGDTNAAKTVDVIRSASLMTVDDPGAARILVEQLAYTAATAELAVSGFQNLTDTFKETRLGGLWRNTYGMLDNRHDARKIIDTLYPEW